MKQKALRAGDAHSHEDEECRKRPRSARECAEAHSFLLGEGSGWSFLLMKRLFTEQNGIPVRGSSGYTPDSVCRPRSYHEAG